MHAEGIGSIVVIDAQSRPVGIFTERDLVAVALGAGPRAADGRSDDP